MIFDFVLLDDEDGGYEASQEEALQEALKEGEIQEDEEGSEEAKAYSSLSHKEIYLEICIYFTNFRIHFNIYLSFLCQSM